LIGNISIYFEDFYIRHKAFKELRKGLGEIAEGLMTPSGREIGMPAPESAEFTKKTSTVFGEYEWMNPL